MPAKATVTGDIFDTKGAPIEGASAVATLIGDDTFDGSKFIASRPIGAKTNAAGRWSMDLIVNGSGALGTTTWTIELFDDANKSMAKKEKLFIATSLPIELDDLVLTSPQNLKAARDASQVRLIKAASQSEYDALPASEKKPGDFVGITGV